MSENLFDNYIKDNLHDYKSHVPQGLWDKVLVDIEKKKKPLPFWKNGYFQSAIIGILAIGLFSAGYITSKKTNTVSSNIKEYVTSPTITKSLVNAVNTTKPNETNRNEENASLSKASKPPTAEKQLVTNNDNTRKNLDEANINNTSAIVAPTPIKKEKAVSVNTEKVTKPTVETNSSGEISKKTITANKKSVASIPVEVVSNPEITETTTIPVVVEATKEDVLNNSIANYFVKGDLVSTDFSVPNPGIINRILTVKPNTITNIHLPNADRKGWTVELYASPDYDIKKVNNNGVSSNYVRIQDSSNKSTGGFTAGFRIGKYIGNNFSIKSGVQFKESTERFRYLKQSDIKDVTVLTTRSYTDNAGATVYIIDTSVIQQKGYMIRTVFNSYKSIEIPLIASWESGLGNWHVEMSGGVIFNLATFYEGQTFDNTYNIVALSSKQTNGFFKSNASVSLFGSLNLLYCLRKDMDAFAEPYYRLAISNNSTSASGYSQRFNSSGINFGIRYKIPSIKGNK